jgi:type I restriction enzyme S subunit
VNPRNTAEDSDIASFVPMTLIVDGFSNCFTFQKRVWSEIKSGFTHFQDGDVGLAKITPCLENKKSVVFNELINGIGAGTTELHIFRPICGSIIPDYLLWFFKNERFIDGCISAFSGVVGQQRVSKDYVSSTLLPLPPLAEQRRIVSAIESAFAVIDELEHSKTDLQSAIVVTKQKILSLAIRGKLVKQDPNDEPASVLLERIRAEREKLISEGKIKRGKGNSSIVRSGDNPYYEKLPEGWAVCRLGDLVSVISGTSYKKSDPINGNGIRVLRGGNIQDTQINLYEDDVFLPDFFFDEEKQVRQGDIIIVASTGSETLIGKAGFAYTTFANVQIGAFLRIIRPELVELSGYLRVIFESDFYRNHIRDCAKGTNINNIKTEYIDKFVVPIPPIAEQNRIVTAIESAFEQLDNIAASLM